MNDYSDRIVASGVALLFAYVVTRRRYFRSTSVFKGLLALVSNKIKQSV
jgi:hypothetical protein